MDNKIKNAVKLSWGEISQHISTIVSQQLGRSVVCKANYEDYNYWGAAAATGTFTVDELKILLCFIKADNNTYCDSLPSDSDTSKSIGMTLSETLLAISLKTTWEHTSICKDGLWLVGLENASMLPQRDEKLLYIDDAVIDTSKLMDKDTLLTKLTDSEGLCSDLSRFSEGNVTMFGNELYWHYPISDSDHAGYYFVLVKEGVLKLPYNYISDLNEEFAIGDAALCSWREMLHFLHNLKEYSDYTIRTLTILSEYLRERGAGNEKA